MTLKTAIKRLLPRQIFAALAPTYHLFVAVFWNVRYGFPARGMQVIGVTGTNGKTTTSFMIHRMLHEAGYKVGLMSTVAYGVGSDIRPQIHHMTNVPVPELMQRLKWMRGQGIEWLVLETTSHALAQHRTWGIPYSIAVFTNITHEHLDYHGTFERYVAAKRMLFEQTARNRHGKQLGIINAADPQAAQFASAVPNSVLYGVGGDLQAQNITTTPKGSEYDVLLDGTLQHIVCHIPGSFNIDNSLAAACVGHAVGLSPQQIAHGIVALDGVEGRMTRIEEGQPFTVIVDFAHTPDSFEKLFKDVRPVVKGKLIVMFGSAGRRDEEKRAIQGSLAGQYADEVVLTEEDDRDIDGQQILSEIAAGASGAGKTQDKDLFLVHDRTEAIKFALSRATSTDDTVLLLGKGHEKTIERANGENPWDEIETTRRFLKK